MVERLDRPTMEIVRRAWTSLMQGYKPDPISGELHFTDNENDFGFLKDIDAVNALIEPFTLAPNSFVDLPIKIDDLVSVATTLLSKIGVDRERDKDVAHSYLGFSANPYPYVQVDVDFVDSAAALLRLNLNIANAFHQTKKALPKHLEKLMIGTSCTAADFLLAACIEDKLGARWPGFIKRVDPPGMYANLFFTNSATLALSRTIENPNVKTWLGQERRDKIEALIPSIALWTSQQYNPATASFWMDEAKTSLQTMGTLYALELLYTLVDPLPEELKKNCRDALGTVMRKMTDLAAASGLQRDFFHSLPIPSGPGVTFYDDRRYIGAFLGLFAQAKKADPDVIDDTFIRASDVLFQGVTDDWIDEPSNLWDDGRPLICFSQDALIGLVKFSLEGKIDVVNLPEFELRSAIRDSLKSDIVIDAIFDTLIEKARTRRNQELAKKFENRS